MGKPSFIHPHRRKCVPLWSAVLFLPALLLASLCPAQSTPPPTTAATAVPLILPSAIVFDPTGNLYLAETANHVIRKIDTMGNITTIAGTSAQGFSGDNGLATSAQLDSPQGLALDSANNLYLADTHNHRIRKLNLTTGLITTIAGTGTLGYSGDAGPATSASLDLPTALALDTANNLYLADTGNHRIRRIDASTGLITTVAGTGTQGFSGDNGPASSASIDSPQGLAFDSSNNLYLADTHNHRIRRIAIATGLITTLTGTGSQSFSGDNAPATAAATALPHGLTLDPSGNLYFADTANHRIRRIDAGTGVITTVVGTGTQGFSGDNAPAASAALDSPRNPILSPINLLTLTDTNNQRIRQLGAPPAPATTIQTIAGLTTPSTESLTLTAPSTLTYGNGAITATLASTTPATGIISFLDKTTPIGSAALASNTATLDISTLPAGAYTITATYAGDQTHNPTQSAALAFTILPAPTIVTLTDLIATASTNPTVGSPITFTSHVSSTISGILTGTVTLLDTATPFLTSPLSASGDATFTTNSLAQGAHTLTAIYNGAENFAPSASTPNFVTIGVGTTPGSDFTLTPTGSTAQTIVSGSAATYTFSIQTTGNLSSPITLAATGLPSFATASFNPATIPPVPQLPSP